MTRRGLLAYHQAGLANCAVVSCMARWQGRPVAPTAGGWRGHNNSPPEGRKISVPFFAYQPKAAYSLSVRSKQRWISAWGGQWHWYQCISCCTATAGCQGMLTQEYTCTHGAGDVCRGALDSLILTYDE